MKKKIIVRGKKIDYQVLKRGGRKIVIKINDQTHEFERLSSSLVKLDGKEILGPAFLRRDALGQKSGVEHKGVFYSMQVPSRQGEIESEGSLLSPMPGKVLKILIQEGAAVKKGDTLVILEAMKMEHTLKAPYDGFVEKIFFQEENQIGAKQKIIEIRQES